MLHALACFHNSVYFQSYDVVVLYVALMRVDLAIALERLLQELQSGLVGELAKERCVTFCTDC